MVAGLAIIFLAPALVAATSVEYYRSASCDAQSSVFFLDKYRMSESLVNDKSCHLTPARTMAVKVMGGLDPGCVVLAYDDYTCTSLVGSVPGNGKCVAASKARIGSWQAKCNTTESTSAESSPSTTYAPGELKRRGKQRLPRVQEERNMTMSLSTSCSSTDATVIASSVASEMSSAINASATKDVAALVTSSPSAGAALSSAIKSGTGIESDLTSYVTTTGNSSYAVPSMTTATSPSTVTFTGTTGSNGTAMLHLGGTTSGRLADGKVLTTLLCGMLALAGTLVI